MMGFLGAGNNPMVGMTVCGQRGSEVRNSSENRMKLLLIV